MMQVRTRSKSKTEIQATLFGSFLLALLIGSMVMAYCCSGPIILGTELNSNGLVEYMCLGNGCESYRIMEWND